MQLGSGKHLRARLENDKNNKKHLKNVGPIRNCEPPHAHSAGVATGTVARRLRINVHDDVNDGQRRQRQRQRVTEGPLWPHGMGPMTRATMVNNWVFQRLIFSPLMSEFIRQQPMNV